MELSSGCRLNDRQRRETGRLRQTTRTHVSTIYKSIYKKPWYPLRSKLLWVIKINFVDYQATSTEAVTILLSADSRNTILFPLPQLPYSTQGSVTQAFFFNKLQRVFFCVSFSDMSNIIPQREIFRVAVDIVVRKTHKRKGQLENVWSSFLWV